ncbi:MAG: cob(I)yrinic acid a,c-diamide adenosyltransferase [Candidatus Ornithomonoglobus sp.]
MKRGLIHIYCGGGKGKTTAAVGLAIRCAGAGGQVMFFQFLKDNSSSERNILSGIDNIDVIDGLEGMKFVWNMTEREKEETRGQYQQIFNAMIKKAGEYDMIVFDEIIPALKYEFVTEEELIAFLKSKPEKTEIVMTGREPSERLCELADYVTEMKKIKHPYDKGIAAREGIEL